MSAFLPYLLAAAGVAGPTLANAISGKLGGPVSGTVGQASEDLGETNVGTDRGLGLDTDFGLVDLVLFPVTGLIGALSGLNDVVGGVAKKGAGVVTDFAGDVAKDSLLDFVLSPTGLVLLAGAFVAWRVTR